MTMKSMAMSQKDRKKYSEPKMASSSKGPRYPWGLEISLDDDSLKKLGIDVSEMSSGAEVVLQGKAKIASISTNDNDGKKRSSLGLQITHMDLSVGGSFEDAFKARVAKEKK